YTARDGGTALAAAVPAPLTEGVRFFSAKHDFPNQWYSFLHPPANATSQILQLGMTLDRFPFATQERGDAVRSSKMRVVIRLASDQRPAPIQVTLRSPTAIELSHKVDDQSLGTLVMKDFVIADQPGTWTVEIKKTDIPAELQD